MKAVNTMGRLFLGKTWVSLSFQAAPGFAFFSSVGVGGEGASCGFSSGLVMFLCPRRKTADSCGRGTGTAHGTWWPYKSSSALTTALRPRNQPSHAIPTTDRPGKALRISVSGSVRQACMLRKRHSRDSKPTLSRVHEFAARLTFSGRTWDLHESHLTGFTIAAADYDMGANRAQSIQRLALFLPDKMGQILDGTGCLIPRPRHPRRPCNSPHISSSLA